MERWVIACIAVVGALVIGGVAGSFVAGALRVWDMPVGGGFAAFSVVSVAYVAAPNRKRAFSALCLVLGAAWAWHLIGNEWYPESYEGLAYEPTHLPFAATVFGGILGLVTTWTAGEWQRRREPGAPAAASSGSPTADVDPR